MKRVLILHTGGTLGMTGSPLVPGAFETELSTAVPELEQIADLETRIVCNLDSSDIESTVWSTLAQLLHAERDNFDGFVIVHGTDTMAYTANALAYALVGFAKPIVMTGAQRPLVSVRTDAKRNLIDAVTVATRNIPEVTICFDGILFRGCRATKDSARDYRAFTSPGTQHLARLGVDVDEADHIRRDEISYQFAPDFGESVAILVVTPALAAEDIVALDRNDGVVLVTFGLGTIPSRNGETFAAFEQLTRTTPVVAITTSSGKVDLSLYPNSRALHDAGVINGGRLGLESATVKLMHGLKNAEDLPAYLKRNVCGEHG